MSYESGLIDNVNILLTKTYDAVEGFKNAADNVSNPILKQYFDASARQRHQFGNELKNEVKRLGGNPERGTSLAGDLHRAWMDVSATLSTKNEEVILKECKRGEEASLKEYQDFVESTNLPITTKSVLDHQISSIKQRIKEIAVISNGIAE